MLCTVYTLLCSVGPFVVSWCMRMEAKNAYFKQVARIGNFKNVAYSVSKRHQRLLCAHLQGKFFSFDELECGPCKQTWCLHNYVHMSFINILCMQVREFVH